MSWTPPRAGRAGWMPSAGPSRAVEGIERRGATPGWSREWEPEGLAAPKAAGRLLAEERARRAQEPGAEECQATGVCAGGRWRGRPDQRAGDGPGAGRNR